MFGFELLFLCLRGLGVLGCLVDLVLELFGRFGLGWLLGWMCWGLYFADFCWLRLLWCCLRHGCYAGAWLGVGCCVRSQVWPFGFWVVLLRLGFGVWFG